MSLSAASQGCTLLPLPKKWGLEEKWQGTDPKSSRDGVAITPQVPQHTWGEGAGLAWMSWPKQPLKVWNLASLSSLELITLIDMFVYNGIYFVVLLLPQLCYFLELERCGCCQRVGKGADLQGMATPSCKAGLGQVRL